MVSYDCEGLFARHVVPSSAQGERLNYSLVMEAASPYIGRIESSLSDLGLCLHHLHQVLNLLDIQSINNRCRCHYGASI